MGVNMTTYVKLRNAYKLGIQKAIGLLTKHNIVSVTPMTVSKRTIGFDIEARGRWHSQPQLIERITIPLTDAEYEDATRYLDSMTFVPVKFPSFSIGGAEELTPYEAFLSTRNILVVGDAAYLLRSLENTLGVRQLAMEIKNLAGEILASGTNHEVSNFCCAYSGMQVMDVDWFYEESDYSVGLQGGFYTRKEAEEEGTKLVHFDFQLKAKNEKQSFDIVIPFSAIDDFMECLYMEDVSFINEALILYGEYLMATLVKQRLQQPFLVLRTNINEIRLYPKPSFMVAAQSQKQQIITLMQQRLQEYNAKYHIVEREARLVQCLKTIVEGGLERVATSKRLIFTFKTGEIHVLISALDIYVVSTDSTHLGLLAHYSLTKGNSYQEMEKVLVKLKCPIGGKTLMNAARLNTSLA